MFASSHEVNADLEKHHLRSRLLRTLRPRRLAAAAAACGDQAGVDALVARLRGAAARCAALPVLDTPRLRAGSVAIAAGLGLLALGAAGVAWQAIDPPPGPYGVAAGIGTISSFIAGIWALTAGRRLRREAHLPKVVATKDVEDASAFLKQLCEDARPPIGTFALQIVSALVTLDSALLLLLAAPVLLPDSVPLVQLLLVGAGAFLTARVSLEAVHATAVAVRSVQVRQLHARKLAESSPQAQQCASVLRETFDGVLQGRWPLSAPGLWAYLPAAGWALVLATIQALLLGVRLMADQDTGTGAVLLIAAAIAALTSVFAVRLAISAEVLVPRVAQAKRLLARFATPEQLQATLDADRDEINDRLAGARGKLVSMLSAREHGARSLQVGPMALRPANEEADERFNGTRETVTIQRSNGGSPPAFEGATAAH